MLPDLLSMFMPKRNRSTAMSDAWDETLPDGRSVYEATAAAAKTGGFFPQREPNTLNDPNDPIGTPVQTLGGTEDTEPVRMDPVTAMPMYPGEEKPRASASIEPDPLSGAYDRRRDILQNGAKRESKFGKRMLVGALMGLGKGLQTGDIAGGITGAATGAALSGFFPGMDRQMRAPYELARVDEEIKGLEQQRTADQKYRMGETAMENTRVDNEYNRERLGEMRADRERKTGDRISRERTSRMNAVAGMFKNLPAFDPDSKEYAEMTKALGDVDLPITKKDSKKKIDLKQDQRTGQWTTVLTDPLTGKQEVRDVMKNGKPFASTPTVVMQGEYGLLRQDDAQSFQASEAEKRRQFDAAQESAKIAAQSAFKQLEQAQGRVKALQNERAKYIAAFQKTNGTTPTEEQINEYLNAVAGQ
jgi:hypothetical protein